MVFNATFNSISVISWRSISLVGETRVPTCHNCTGSCKCNYHMITTTTAPKMISKIVVKKEFEDIKRVIRLRKLKDRQYNGQKENRQKDKQRSKKHTHKTKDRVTRTPLKTRGELRCSGRISSFCSTSGIRHVK